MNIINAILNKNLYYKNIIKALSKQYLYTISLYFRRIAGAFSVFFIARYLSVYDYGLYASYVNIANYLLLFANLGFNEYILVSSQNNVTKVRIKQAIFIIFGILLCIVFSLTSYFIKIENHTIFLLILYKTFFDGAFFALALPYFQAAKKFNQIAIINIFYSIGIIIIAISALILKLSLIKFLILCIILGLTNFIQCSLGTKINYISIIKKPIIILKMVDKNILPYSFVTLMMVTRDQLPSLSVSILMSKEQAALYFAAFNIASISSLFATAQLQQIMPTMIKATSTLLINIMKKSALIIFYINLGIIIFLAIFGKQILVLLYGKEFYANSYILLLLISAIMMISGVSGILGYFITARGFQKFKLKCQIEFIILSIISISIFFKYGIYALVCVFVLVQLYAIPRYGFFVYNKIKQLKMNEQYEQNNF